MAIHFAQPQWLWIGALACAALIALLWRGERKRREAIRRFAAASPDSSIAPGKRWLRHGLAVLGLAMAATALARPLAGYRWERSPHQGTDLMFAVDTSKSMRAADLRPDRLTRAKLAVADLVRKFDGERVGLIAFAGDAFVQAPMTADRGVFLEALEALDTDVIPRGGSDLASAFHAAEQAMASEPDHRKVLVLLSDGEDLAGNAIDAAREAAAQGLTIYAVGVGSQRGELIQVANAAGEPELVRDENGEPVRSRLDEAALRSIAKLTGGAYQPLGADGRGLDALYQTALIKLPRSNAAGTAHKVYTERFQIPLAIALGCLLVELLIGDRRRRRRIGAAAAPQVAGLAVMALALFGAPRPAAAAPRQDGAVAAYNAGTSTYRGGDFAAAQRQFEDALQTGNVGLQVDTYYDLGNARYRVGQATLEKDRDATIASWKKSIEAYDAALALAPRDADARFNRDLVARKLAELEKQKQQKQQKQDQKQQGQKDQKQQNQNGQGQQQQRPQDGQGKKDQKQQNQDGQGQQQPKPQEGQGQQQQPKPQEGQGQQQQPKPQEGQGQQQQPKPQEGQGKAEQQKAEQQQPRPQEGQGKAEQQKAEQQKAAAAAAEARADAARRAAGQLTHGEAVQLLDSVEHELRPLPIHGRKGTPPEETRIKDW